MGMRDNIFPRKLSGEFEAFLGGQPNNPFDRAHEYGILGPDMPYWHRNATTEGPRWLHEATAHVVAAMSTIDPEERRHHMVIARELHTENIPMVTFGSLYTIWAASTRLGNVPEEVTAEDMHRSWSRPVFHEQLYFRQPP
jgi:ABC-type transport system substrate-binding protein